MSEYVVPLLIGFFGAVLGCAAVLGLFYYACYMQGAKDDYREPNK